MPNASSMRVSAQVDASPEIWRDVVGYEGRYEVSDQGRVWSIKSGKILSPGPTSKGYLTVQLYDGSIPKKPRTRCVHDLVMAAFVGPKPLGYQVDHGRRGKQCNALDNLDYVTPEENERRSRLPGGPWRPRGKNKPKQLQTA